MSKFGYKNKNICDYKIKRLLMEDDLRSLENCDITQKIRNLEMEGVKLRHKVENILQESSTVNWYQDGDLVEERSISESEEPWNTGNYIKHNELCYNIRDTQVEDYKQQLECMQQQHKQYILNHELDLERLSNIIIKFQGTNNRLQNNLEKQTDELQAVKAKYNCIIERLNCSVTQLLQVNKEQEKVLNETGEKLEDAKISMKAIANLRDLLTDIEYYQGVTLVTDIDVESSEPEKLVVTIEKCFKQFNSELDDKSHKINDLEEHIIKIKEFFTNENEKSALEYRNQLACFEDQNIYLKQQMNEINQKAEFEMDNLTKECSIIKRKMEEDYTNMSSVIDNLECNLQEVINKNEKLNEILALEKKSFEDILDLNEKQFATTLVERNNAINQYSSISAKLDATVNQLSETENHLLQIQSEKYDLEKEIESLQKCHTEMETSLVSSRRHLENIIQVVHSCMNNVELYDNKNETFDTAACSINEREDHGRIWKPKTYQIEEIIYQIKSLNEIAKDLDCKYETLIKHYKVIEKELEVVNFHRRNIEQSFMEQLLEMDIVKNVNSHLSSLIDNRDSERERLTSEKEDVMKLLKEKTEELAMVESKMHQMAVSLEERNSFMETQDNTNWNNDSKRPIIDTTLGKYDVLKEDRNRIFDELREIKSAYEALLLQEQSESLSLQKYQQENKDLQRDLEINHREYDELVADRKRLSLKLKESENEITNLCRELQNSHRLKSKKDISLEKKVSELVIELANNKTILKLAQETIKDFQKAGSRSNQKKPQIFNIDGLVESAPTANNFKLATTRLYNLEQQMSDFETSQKELKKENHKLIGLLKKVTLQNEQLSEELESFANENKNLRDCVRKFNIEYTFQQEKNEKISKKMNEMSNPLEFKRLSNNENINKIKNKNKIPSLSLTEVDISLNRNENINNILDQKKNIQNCPTSDKMYTTDLKNAKNEEYSPEENIDKYRINET